MSRNIRKTFYIFISTFLFLCCFTCGQIGVISDYKIFSDSLTFLKKFDSVFDSTSEYYPKNEWLKDDKETKLDYNFLVIRNLYLPELNEGVVFSIDYTINRQGQKIVGFGLREVIRKENGILMHYQEKRLSNKEIEYYDNIIKSKILNKLGFHYTSFDWNE